METHCPTCICGTAPEPPDIDAATLIADALELLAPAECWTQTAGIWPPPDDPLAGGGGPALALDAYGGAAPVPLSYGSYDRAARWTAHGAIRPPPPPFTTPARTPPGIPTWTMPLRTLAPPSLPPYAPGAPPAAALIPGITCQPQTIATSWQPSAAPSNPQPDGAGAIPPINQSHNPLRSVIMLTLNLDCAGGAIAPDVLSIAASRYGRLPEPARRAYYDAIRTAADAYAETAPAGCAHYARLYHHCAGGAIADAIALRRAHNGALDLLLAARFGAVAAIADTEPECGGGAAPNPIAALCSSGRAPEFHSHVGLMQAHATASVPAPSVIAIAYLAAALPEPWNPATEQPARECPVGAADDTFDGTCHCWTGRRPQAAPHGAFAPQVYWRCAGGGRNGAEPDGLLASYDRAIRAIWRPAMDNTLANTAPPYRPQTTPVPPGRPPSTASIPSSGRRRRFGMLTAPPLTCRPPPAPAIAEPAITPRRIGSAPDCWRRSVRRNRPCRRWRRRPLPMTRRGTAARQTARPAPQAPGCRITAPYALQCAPAAHTRPGAPTNGPQTEFIAMTTANPIAIVRPADLAAVHAGASVFLTTAAVNLHNGAPNWHPIAPAAGRPPLSVLDGTRRTEHALSAGGVPRLPRGSGNLLHGGNHLRRQRH